MHQFTKSLTKSLRAPKNCFLLDLFGVSLLVIELRALFSFSTLAKQFLGIGMEQINCLALELVCYSLLWRAQLFVHTRTLSELRVSDMSTNKNAV